MPKLVKKIERVGSFLLNKEDTSSFSMYLSMYDVLHDICAKYGAKIDLTTPNKIYVVDSTSGCRKTIRRTYGNKLKMSRINKVVELLEFI